MRQFKRFRSDTEYDMMHLEQVRDVIKRSREMLAKPVPDTFAGHKTQEPFPQEDETSRFERWLKSKELQPRSKARLNGQLR